MARKTPAEQVQLLVRQLHGLGVDSRLLEQVSIHLPQNYENPDHWGELAVVLRRAQNYGAAELVYKAALVIHERSARLWNNYGILLRDWGKLDEALSAYEHSIELDPSYAKALANKGRILELLHKFAEARSCYQAALDIDPSDVGATNNIGVCLLGEHQLAQAELWFEKTLQLNPNWTDALFNLALLRIDRDDFESAQHMVDRLSQLLPQDAEVGKLQARLRDRANEPIKFELPQAQRLESESDLSPAVRKLGNELAGNPRSIFISYAWPDPLTKQFAARLSRDLKSRSFQVVLDQELGLEVYEVLYLLPLCQNVVVLNDTHYAESCLLGKVPISHTTSVYPSFAFPIAATQSKEYLEMVFKISAVAWEMAKNIHEKETKLPNDLAFQLAQPESFRDVPGLRQFIEGWRVDEIQMVFSNLKRFRSISVAYLKGKHALAGYPLLDFSEEEYYPFSFTALLKILELGMGLKEDDLPIQLDDHPDWTGYRWPDSSIVSAKLWKIASEEVAVWRPSITPSGDAAAIISKFKDWIPM
jgi:Tfp pilus assembly protein PilF